MFQPVPEPFICEQIYLRLKGSDGSVLVQVRFVLSSILDLPPRNEDRPRPSFSSLTRTTVFRLK